MQLQEQSPKSEDDLPESTVISRRQAELETANARLQRTAQNFSTEWKSFLSYAMQIKQQRPTGGNDLEDLLLKTQGGLVLLRDLDHRRKKQWNEVLKRYGYQHPSTISDTNSALKTTTQSSQNLVSDLQLLQQKVAATAHCAVTRSQFTRNLGSVSAHSLPVLVKLRALAVETHHRLHHGSDSPIEDVVHVEDVNLLMQFKYLENQQAVVLERVGVRLKWLTVSHRFHLRQRMLALVHQQKAKNTPRPNAATDHNSKDHLHCPLFIMSTSHFAAELNNLAQKFSSSIPDVQVADGKTCAKEYLALKQEADALLASSVSAFPPDNAINTDGRLETGLDSLAHAYTRNSRWELIQRGYIGDCEPSPGRIEDSLVLLRNSHKIDSLLANEWELLGLDDVSYLRVRLEALSRAHMNRAKVDVAKQIGGDSILVDHHAPLMQEDTADSDEADVQIWNSDAIHSLYLLRVASCRAKRLSLLRLLNYLHFIQLSQTPVTSTASSKPGRKTSIHFTSKLGVSAAVSAPWTVTKCEKTGDNLVKRQTSSEKKEDVDENSDNKDEEFIFAAARRDLEVLELQMLRVASIFLFKQEYESLPTSPRKCSDHDADTVVTPIDRLQVLRDIYDCEVAFQQAKAQLAEKLLENGLWCAPRLQDMDELGFSTATKAQTEPFAEILFPLLQRRPLIDFSHAYFFESYAAETILLDLQTSLVQQMGQHFQRLEWSEYHEFAFGDRESGHDEQSQWLCRHILGANVLTRLYSQQDELLREADAKWFTATSIGEFHALQHALLEQTLVAWSLIIKLELPGRPIRCLERSAGDLLQGSGWQLVLPPQLLSDVCQTLFNESEGSSSRTLIEWSAEALALENWRRKLAKSVYEAQLLERIHNFHFGFVKQISAFDTVLGGEQARQLPFVFDCGDCDRAKALQPLAVELEMPMLAAPALKHALLRSEDSRSISEWLQAQLSARSDDTTLSKHSKAWRQSLLVLQQQYTTHLEVIVSYQDAIGGDVFEFAASYPFVCLANSLAPDSSSSSDESPTLAMDINTVRSKYAKEIADKMMEQMKTSCFPYWTRLDTFKQQLQERFTSPTNDVFASQGDLAACARFLSDESSQPKLLTTLNSHVQYLRNERKLMQQLSPSTRARCAFIADSTASSRSTTGGEADEEEQPSGLMRWLMVKLHQLKVDLHIHERPKVEQLLLTPPASCSSPSASCQRAKRTFGTSPLESCSPDTQMLLQTLPSFRYLLDMFATTGNYERSRRESSGGAASAHATRLHEHREETLLALLSIFRHFRWTMDLLRIQCGSHFTSTKKTSVGNNVSTTIGRHTGLGRLERWQSQFHHEIRHLLDHITGRFSVDASLAIGDLFDTRPEQLQSQHHAAIMRREFCAALQETIAHLARVLKCTATFALLQTYEKTTSLGVRRRRQNVITFQSSVETMPAEGMSRLVNVAERALFSEARPQNCEREWFAFSDAVNKYEERDSAYISTLTRLLELHRVFIDENCQVFHRLEDETAPSSQGTAEKQALVALEDLWERFHLPAWDSAIRPAVSPGISPSKDLSYAVRSLQMGATPALVQFCNTGLLVLPPPSTIDDQLVYLSVSVELTWVNADMKELEEQHSTFLFHRKRHREYQRTSNGAQKRPQSSYTSPSLLALSQYFHEEGVSTNKTLQSPSAVPAFVVPATDMARFLHAVTVHCQAHSKQQLNLHETFMQQLHDECQAAALDRENIAAQRSKAKLEERIRREAFAADHAFQLYFEVEALRKQLSAMDARKELDRQELRCELSAEYDEKLHAMHTELLNKQQKFAEYRTTMQREMQTVIQGAHLQFVDQLLDYSGAIPSATKTSVSTLLRGQQDIVRTKSENAAMKQALLKVQALGDMQQQTQHAVCDRELLLAQRYATAKALQRNEVEQLQTYVKQLEGNLSKLAQEKTFFQVKWTTAQKQVEATTQRRREAKIRALSASHTRTSAAKGLEDDEPPAGFTSTRTAPDNVSDIASVLDGNIARPQTATSQELQRLEAQYLNSARHYQNEIRRLQQQVTREVRAKGAMAEQLTQLRQYESSASIHGLPLVETPKSPTAEGQIDYLLSFTPRRSQSASPRAPVRSQSCVATPPDRTTTANRPNSSFSPRASLLRAQVSVGTGLQPPVLVSSACSSRPSSSSGAPARKFQVVTRDTNVRVGGVAGMANTFSVREPLPYR